MKRNILLIIAFFLALSAAAQTQLAEEFSGATLAGKSSGKITLDEIMNAGRLQCSKPVQITHFALTVINNGVLICRTSNSEKITDPMITQLKQLKQNQRFIIEEIRGIKPGGDIIRMKTLSFIFM